MDNQEEPRRVKHKVSKVKKEAKLQQTEDKAVENNNTERNVEVSGTSDGQKKKKNNKKKSKGLADPIKIIESILGDPESRQLNLSEEIDRKFATEPFKLEVRNQLLDIRYLATVGETLEGITDIFTTVLPKGIEGEVNIPPSAIMKLNCINKMPEKRQRGKRWGNNKKQQQQQKNVQNGEGGGGGGESKLKATKEKQQQ